MLPRTPWPVSRQMPAETKQLFPDAVCTSENHRFRATREAGPLRNVQPKSSQLTLRVKSNEEKTGAAGEASRHPSFREIFETYVDGALRVAVGILGDAEEAEDVVQEMFVRLHRSLPNLRSRSALRAYVYRATVHTALNALRRGRDRRWSVPPSKGELRASPAEDPHRKLEGEEVYRAILRFLVRIPLQQRVAFLLREIEGLGLDEVARALGCAPSTARVHLHLARKALREMIEREYPEFLEGR